MLAVCAHTNITLNVSIKILALCLLMNLALQCRTPSPELRNDLIGPLFAAFWSTKLYVDTYVDKYIRIFVQYIYIYIQSVTK
jgi:hypothetical protein